MQESYFRGLRIGKAIETRTDELINRGIIQIIIKRILSSPDLAKANAFSASPSRIASHRSLRIAAARTI